MNYLNRLNSRPDVFLKRSSLKLVSYTLFNSTNEFIQPDSLIETFKILPNSYFQLKEKGSRLNKLNLMDSILTFYYLAMPPVITLPKLKFKNFYHQNSTKAVQATKTTTIRFCIEIDHGSDDRQILWPRTVQSFTGNSNPETKSRDFREFYYDGEIKKNQNGIFTKTNDLESKVQLEPSKYCQENADFKKKNTGSSLFLDVEYTINTDDQNWSLVYIDLLFNTDTVVPIRTFNHELEFSSIPIIAPDNNFPFDDCFGLGCDSELK